MINPILRNLLILLISYFFKGSNGVWDLKKNFALLELLERLEDAAKEKENIFTTTFLERERELSVCCDENEDHIAVVYCTTCATHLCEEVI